MKAHIKGARILHIISAFWTLALALLIFSDVMGRIFLTRPIPGTKEILQNSIVTITFLQIPLAIYSGSMLRTTILSDAVPPTMRRILRTLASLLGLALFLALILYYILANAYPQRNVVLLYHCDTAHICDTFSIPVGYTYVHNKLN